ncbi:unnamed protein product, partial [Brassica oleracea]
MLPVSDNAMDQTIVAIESGIADTTLVLEHLEPHISKVKEEASSRKQILAQEEILSNILWTPQALAYDQRGRGKDYVSNAEPVAEACAQLTQEFFKGDTLCRLITSLHYLNLEFGDSMDYLKWFGAEETDLSLHKLEEMRRQLAIKDELDGVGQNHDEGKRVQH